MSARRYARWSSLWGALVVAALVAVGCGGKDEPAAAPAVAVDAAPAAPTPPAHPKTEADLVERFTVAMEKRDVPGLKTLVSAELGAELHRWHDKDAEAFWGRGQRWIDNVRSGVEIAFKQEAQSDKEAARWRALLKFDNGEEETIIFTRVDGKLLIAEL